MSANSIEPGEAEQADNAGMPSVGRRKRVGKLVQILSLAGVFGVGLAWATMGIGHEQGGKDAPSTGEVANRLAPLAMPDKPPPLPEAPPPVQTLLDAAPAAAPAAPAGPHVPTWEERKLGFTETEAVPPQAAAAVDMAPGDSTPAGEQAPPAQPAAGSFAARLEAPAIEMVRATRLPDPDYTISAGRLLDCLLDTRIDSTLPGRMKCHLDSDVYSDSKRVVLMEAGTEFLGEQAGGILHGQQRQFALFLRGRTPNGIAVNLNSPATDALGASGIEGWVDTQFRKRFGAAIAIALMQDAVAVAVASQSAGGGQNTFVLGNTAQAGTSLAEKALESSINIPSILHTRQGERIQVMTARDIDMSDVYKLKGVQ
jgi:type IV secretion system protein VirB10